MRTLRRVIAVLGVPATRSGGPSARGRVCARGSVCLLPLGGGYVRDVRVAPMVSASSYPVGSRGRRRPVAAVGVIAAMFVVVLAVGASVARAAGSCSASGGTTTCTFGSTGSQDTFVVPAGVTSIQVVATGAPGAV